jgi:exodeoxyribonuclease III
MTILRLISWNINGARAIHKAGFLDWLADATPDIMCLQETRATEAQLPPDLAQPASYRGYWHACERKKGYSGTGLLTRIEPAGVSYGIGRPEFDDEGRTMVATYPWFTLINCYFPNGGRDHDRLAYKLAFYDAFLEYTEALRGEGRELVICGDVNTAHREIDLARPKANRNTTGFLPEERAWMDRFVAAGYVDTFRRLNGDVPGQYTWWLQWAKARENNVGWRIDYFFVTPGLVPALRRAFILPEVRGSDHCPVGLEFEVAAEDGGPG